MPSWLYVTIGLSFEGWLILYPLWRAKRRNPTLRLKPTPAKFFREAGLAVPLVILVYIILVMIGAVFYLIAGNDALPRDIFENRRVTAEMSVGLLLYALTACTLAPLAEELFFRGLLYNALKQKLPWVVALFAQAFLFAFLHPQPVMNVVFIFVIGLLLALIYDWRKTLWTPVFIHVLMNSVTMFALLIAIADNANAPALGVIAEDRPGENGCSVTKVISKSPAEKAGLQVKDFIVGVDSQGILDFRHFIRMIRSREIGQTVTVQFYRGEVLLETHAVLEGRKKVYVEEDEKKR